MKVFRWIHNNTVFVIVLGNIISISGIILMTPGWVTFDRTLVAIFFGIVIGMICSWVKFDRTLHHGHKQFLKGESNNPNE